MPRTDHNAKTEEFYFGTFGEISIGIDNGFVSAGLGEGLGGPLGDWLVGLNTGARLRLGLLRPC